MTVSPGILVLSLAIGIPLLLLAIGVVYHAYVLGQQATAVPAEIDDLNAHVEALATESAEQLLTSLQEMMAQMQGQLTSQRASLERLLSDQGRAPAAMPVLAPVGMSPGGGGASMADQTPMAAGEFVPQAPGPAPTNDLRYRVRELATEGLSDRAIARQLGIGLEEVRIARMRGLRP